MLYIYIYIYIYIYLYIYIFISYSIVYSIVHVTFEGSFSKELNKVKEVRELYDVLLGFVYKCFNYFFRVFGLSGRQPPTLLSGPRPPAPDPQPPKNLKLAQPPPT